MLARVVLRRQANHLRVGHVHRLLRLQTLVEELRGEGDELQQRGVAGHQPVVALPHRDEDGAEQAEAIRVVCHEAIEDDVKAAVGQGDSGKQTGFEVWLGRKSCLCRPAGERKEEEDSCG